MIIIMMRFLLDTNVFIEAYQRYYAFDLIPAFWDLLIGNAEAGSLYTIDKVESEISKMDDKLSLWFKSYPEKSVLKTADIHIINIYRHIINQVSNDSQYRDSAKSEFAAGADGWLVALAKTQSMTLVTQEVFIPDCRKRVPIPNICREHDVDCLGTFDMMRKIGIKIT